MSTEIKTAKQILLGAADIIKKNGLFKGKSFEMKFDEIKARDCRTGPCCTLGAMRLAIQQPLDPCQLPLHIGDFPEEQ